MVVNVNSRRYAIVPAYSTAYLRILVLEWADSRPCFVVWYIVLFPCFIHHKVGPTGWFSWRMRSTVRARVRAPSSGPPSAARLARCESRRSATQVRPRSAPLIVTHVRQKTLLFDSTEPSIRVEHRTSTRPVSTRTVQLADYEYPRQH